jgi:hypothetical protein
MAVFSKKGRKDPGPKSKTGLPFAWDKSDKFSLKENNFGVLEKMLAFFSGGLILALLETSFPAGGAADGGRNFTYTRLRRSGAKGEIA